MSTKYKSLEEIEQDFKTKLDATEDTDTRAVLIEQRAEAKADFRSAQTEARLRQEAETREAQVKTRERQAWIREALVEFPLAQQMPELIAGDTEEQIKTAAKTTHERVQKIQHDATEAAKATQAQQQTATDPAENQQQIVQQAQQAYGNASVGGGETPKEVSDREQKLQDYAAKYNSDRSGQFWGERRNIHPAETDEFIRLRGGPHMLERMLGTAIQKYGDGSPMVEAIKQQVAVPQGRG